MSTAVEACALDGEVPGYVSDLSEADVNLFADSENPRLSNQFLAGNRPIDVRASAPAAFTPAEAGLRVQRLDASLRGSGVAVPNGGSLRAVDHSDVPSKLRAGLRSPKVWRDCFDDEL
jgi:hypothetical protein